MSSRSSVSVIWLGQQADQDLCHSGRPSLHRRLLLAAKKLRSCAVWRPSRMQLVAAGHRFCRSFNWPTQCTNASPEVREKTGMFVHQAYFDDSDRIQGSKKSVPQAYPFELGSPKRNSLPFGFDNLEQESIRGPTQGQGGGSGGPNVHEWHTPRSAYQNTNMLAQLPAALDEFGAG